MLVIPHIKGWGIYSPDHLTGGVNFYPKIFLFNIRDYPPYMTFCQYSKGGYGRGEGVPRPNTRVREGVMNSY